VNFLIDAQLPVRLARRLAEAGHDAIHSSELPDANRTTDANIAQRADAEDRVVVTKDRDFRDRQLLQTTPRRLLVVATGNISNNDLVALFDQHSTRSWPPWRRRTLSSLPTTASSFTAIAELVPLPTG
jgi:predicted nuclease of predicted toxin-antitoxin system